MYVEGLLQTDDEPGPVELDREDGVGVAVVADLGALLEVAHLGRIEELVLPFINRSFDSI